jgi:hypothetical protein
VIDLLFYLGLATALLLFLTRRTGPRALLAGFAAASALAHTAGVALLYARPAAFAYVAFPSPAALAGLHGAGTVTEAGGAPAAPSVGAFLGRSLASAELRVGTTGGRFERAYAVPARAWWEGVDSYDLEEASGGLVFFPRRPVYRSFLPPVYLQTDATANEVLRIESVSGKPTATIPALLAELEGFPRDGVLSLRVMRPGPSDGLATLYYSPYQFPAVPELRPVRADELAQRHLGLSGLLLLARREGARHWLLRGVGATPIYGPAGFAERLRKFPEDRRAFRPDPSPKAFPRLTLFPLLHAGAFATWLPGLAAAYVRPVLELPRLRHLPALWPDVPKQYYLLDDGYGAASLLFRVAALAASLALALGAWRLLLRLAPGAARHRGVVLFGIAMMLQLADLLQIRVF